jgi:serine protease
VSDLRPAFPRLLSMIRAALSAWIRRLVPTLLVSAAVAVLSISAAQSAAPTRTADFYRSQQWTLGALHVSSAWGYSRGHGVTVAVLDTGVDGRQADLTGQVIDGPDFTGGLRRPGSRYWGRHGTSMASVIAGHGHGESAGIMGVAPEAKVLSIRATSELTDPARARHTRVDRTRTAVAKGIRYAADHGAQVISMSLGGGMHFYNGNRLEAAAVRYALRKGIVLVASAGNDGGGANRRTYPAAYPGVIAVGAVDRDFRATGFTNRHTYVSVAAPGVQVISADVSGQGYVLSSGTSVSAALVAGMSALIKSRYPRLTPAEVKQALEQGATHRPTGGRSSAIGTGVADAFGGLRAAALINQAEHGGATVNAPPADPAPTPKGGGPDVVLIAVLSGGGTLMVLSFVLGWRQRRRHAPAPQPPWQPREAPDETPWGPREEPDETPWQPREAPDKTPWKSREAPDETPWQPREAPDKTPWKSREAPDKTPWQPREAPDETPWRPRQANEPEPPAPWPPRLEPYRPPSWTTTNGNGHVPSRESGEPDPLGDDRMDSSSDVGTPLADESWESIHQGFDRIKEDTRNWGWTFKDDDPPPAPDGEETVDQSVVRPEDEHEA